MDASFLLDGNMSCGSGERRLCGGAARHTWTPTSRNPEREAHCSSSCDAYCRRSDCTSPRPTDHRREQIRAMCEDQLNRICRDVARSVNTEHAARLEPFENTSFVDFTKLSHTSKFPNHSAERKITPRRRHRKLSSSSIRGERSQVTNEDSRGLGSPAIDLTEPYFDDLPAVWHDSSDEGLHSELCGRCACRMESCRGSSLSKLSISSYSETSDTSGIIANDILSTTSDSCLSTNACDVSLTRNFKKRNQFYDHGENSFSSKNYHPSNLYSVKNSAEKRFESFGKRKLPNGPRTAFQLFSYKLLPLLRVPESEVQKTIGLSWENLPTAERYAFQMQAFLLEDIYQKTSSHTVGQTDARNILCSGTTKMELHNKNVCRNLLVDTLCSQNQDKMTVCPDSPYRRETSLKLEQSDELPSDRDVETSLISYDSGTSSASLLIDENNNFRESNRVGVHKMMGGGSIKTEHYNSFSSTHIPWSECVNDSLTRYRNVSGGMDSSKLFVLESSLKMKFPSENRDFLFSDDSVMDYFPENDLLQDSTNEEESESDASTLSSVSSVVFRPRKDAAVPPQ